MSQETRPGEPWHYRAVARHTNTCEGIVCWWRTWDEAIEWLATWPHALEWSIMKEPMERADGNNP